MGDNRGGHEREVVSVLLEGEFTECCINDMGVGMYKIYYSFDLIFESNKIKNCFKDNSLDIVIDIMRSLQDPEVRRRFASVLGEMNRIIKLDSLTQKLDSFIINLLLIFSRKSFKFTLLKLLNIQKFKFFNDIIT